VVDDNGANARLWRAELCNYDGKQANGTGEIILSKLEQNSERQCVFLSVSA
jgi:hypothetical protein